MFLILSGNTDDKCTYALPPVVSMFQMLEWASLARREATAKPEQQRISLFKIELALNFFPISKIFLFR